LALYLRARTQNTPQQIWEIDSDKALRLGITHPEGGPGSFYERGTAKSIWHALEVQTGWLRADDITSNPFRKLKFEPGNYHPRIARPMVPRPPDAKTFSPSVHLEKDVLAMGIGQAIALMRRLEVICQTVHPNERNMTAFGHEIRSLLILSATEAETHWRGILTANGHHPRAFNTNEYVKLVPLMKLDQYAVKFPQFPWLSALRPFEGWNKAEATKSLTWYDAYNGTKHNREMEFERGNLLNAFHAVSACIVMLAAQFGRSVGLGGQSDLSAFFQFSSIPEWEDDECYIALGFEGDWTSVPAKF
jgi:hypothetical protein